MKKYDRRCTCQQIVSTLFAVMAVYLESSSVSHVEFMRGAIPMYISHDVLM